MVTERLAKHYSFWCPWKRVQAAILDQFHSFKASAPDACKHIPSLVTDVMYQKLKHFLYSSSKDRFNTKIQSQFPKFVGPFISPKKFNSTSLKSYLFKRWQSMQIAVRANGCVIFLENQIVFSKSFRVLASYSKIPVSRNSEHGTDWNWTIGKVHDRNFGSLFGLSWQIKKARLSVAFVVSFYFICTKSSTL